MFLIVLRDQFFRCVFLFFIKYDKDHEHDHSGRNGNVGYIEYGPAGHAVSGEMDKQEIKLGNIYIKKFTIQKVDNASSEYTVCQVPKRAAEYNDHGQAREQMLTLYIEKITQYGDAGNRRKYGKKYIFAKTDSECHAGIFYIGYSEKIADHSK